MASSEEVCLWTPFTKVGDWFGGDELDWLDEFMVAQLSGGDNGSVLGLSDVEQTPFVGQTTGLVSSRGRPIKDTAENEAYNFHKLTKVQIIL